MKKTFKTALAMAFCIVTILSTMVMASALGTPTVKVKGVVYNAVGLYWTTVSGADYYQIQRTTDGKNWTTLSSNYAKTSCTDSKSLTTGKSYGYRVRAVDKGLFGRLTYSAWSKMVTAKPVPAKVANLKVKSTTHSSVQLTWDKVAGATGYTIQYISGNAWKTYKSITGNTINITGLPIGKTFSYRVAAYRIVSKKAVYGPVSEPLKAGAVLKAPTTVALTALNSTALQIQWTASAGAKGYEIYNGATKKWVNTKTTPGIIISGLKPGTKYQFAVRPYSGTYKGPQTKTYTFQTSPAAPTGLKVTSATNKTITISWNKVTGAAGYHVQRSTDNKNWTNIATATTSNSITASGLAGNTKYYFRVRAYINNSNVHKISATAYGAYSGVINYTTVLSAPTVKAASTDNKTVTLTWNKVSGAKAYMVERFDTTFGEWYVYAFNKGQWISPANVDRKEADGVTNAYVTTTTALSLADKGQSLRSDVYRVSAINSKDQKCTPSAEVNGYTKSIHVVQGKHPFNLQQIVRFPKNASAAGYRIYTRYPINAVKYVDLDLTKDKSSVYPFAANANYVEMALYLAPKSIHSIMIVALDKNGTEIGSSTGWLSFSIGDVPIYASNHSYYYASVNSQLLYLARAINNTKAYRGELTVKNNSKVTYSINYLKMPAVLSILIGGPINGVCDTPEEVAKLFSKLGDGEDVETSSTETYNETLTFVNGSAKNADGKTVYLRTYVEPSSNSTYSAYIHDSKNYTAWRNGFESVKTTKNSDGSYTITCTLKQETGTANYHTGLLSSFNAADFSAAEGFKVNNLKIGKSTITATIGADGILKSYKASSPYSATFSAGFTAEEDSEDGNIQAGQLIEMTMGMSGSTAFDYTFTK